MIIRTLKLVKMESRILDKCFDMKHLWLKGCTIEMKFFLNARKYSPNLTKLTLDRCDYIKLSFPQERILSTQVDRVDDNINIKCYNPLNIQTMKLINVSVHKQLPYILDNSKNIQDLNLNNSLKHMTLHLSSTWVSVNGTTFGWWSPNVIDVKKCIDRLLTKYYFDKLEYVNLLFKQANMGLINEIFDKIVLNKSKLSTYSSTLKQVNIGFAPKHKRNKQKVGYVFALYKNGVLEKDLKKLNGHKQMCKKLLLDDCTSNVEFADGWQRFNELLNE